MKGLSELQKRKIRDYWRCRDVNGNGRLDWEDFSLAGRRIIEAMGWAKDSPEAVEALQRQRDFWERLLANMDEDGDGVVSLDEFIGFFITLAAEIGPDLRVPIYALGHVNALLRAMDINGDTTISEQEYALYLRSIGSDADPSVGFAKLDLNGDGKIDLAEMESMYAQWVVSDDPADPGNWLVTGRLP